MSSNEPRPSIEPHSSHDAASLNAPTPPNDTASRNDSESPDAAASPKDSASFQDLLKELGGELSLAHRRTLLDVAAAAIDYGLKEQGLLPLALDDYPERLRQPQASFVTLRIDHKLRGCMGSLQATEPLVVNVARNACAAAFRDPRFVPLAREEFPQLSIHLSLLGAPEPIACESEAQLLSLVRPGIDGLTLIEGTRRATLLPAVWETLPNPRDFLIQLKRKAGLAPDYWSPSVRVERYTAESVGEDG
jgi:uncharacterized protein